MTRRTLYLPVMIAAAVAVACAVALSAVSEKAEATFPDKNGRIAYASYEGGYAVGHDVEIYTINPDGSGKRQLTNNDTDDFNPDYSPDGNRITYMGFEGRIHLEKDQDASANIYTIKAGGGGKSRVTNNDAYPQKLSWGSRP